MYNYQGKEYFNFFDVLYIRVLRQFLFYFEENKGIEFRKNWRTPYRILKPFGCKKAGNVAYRILPKSSFTFIINLPTLPINFFERGKGTIEFSRRESLSIFLDETGIPLTNEGYFFESKSTQNGNLRLITYGGWCNETLPWNLRTDTLIFTKIRILNLRLCRYVLAKFPFFSLAKDSRDSNELQRAVTTFCNFYCPAFPVKKLIN